MFLIKVYCLEVVVYLGVVHPASIERLTMLLERDCDQVYNQTHIKYCRNPTISFECSRPVYSSPCEFKDYFNGRSHRVIFRRQRAYYFRLNSRGERTKSVCSLLRPNYLSIQILNSMFKHTLMIG